MYSENEDFNDEYEESTNNNGSLGDKVKEFYESNKKMVLILAGLLLVFIILLMMNSCSKNPNDVSGGNNSKLELILTPTENYLTLDNSVQLIASVEPKGAYDDPQYNWESSDDTIASVDSLGNVTGLKLGVAKIKVSFLDDKRNSYSKECEIHVIEGSKDITLTNVKFPEGELLIARGDTFKLQKNVSPSNGLVEKIVLTSSNTSIVDIVDSNGTIKALSDGIATIYMDVNDGKFKDELVVNVVSDNIDPEFIINPTGILFDSRELSMVVSDTRKLSFQVLPTSAYVKDVKWSSSDESIVTVDNEGNVYAKSVGTAVITINGRNNTTDKMTIKVEQGIVKVTSIEVRSSKNLTLNINGTETIVANVLPNDATNKIVKYESNNPSIASVNDNGLVRALSKGSTMITITTDDGNYKEYVSVTVNGNDDSSGGSSNGGSSSGGGNSCSSNSIVTLKSDSGGAITTTKGGNDDVATKSKITLETSSSCGNIREIKWCSYKEGSTECNPITEFKIGDKLTLNVPTGEGVMILKFVAHLDSEKTLEPKIYYMKYKVSSSGNDEEISNNTTFTADTSWMANDLLMDNLSSYASINIRINNATANINKVLYCYASNGGSCTINYTNYEKGPSKYFPLNSVKWQYSVNASNKTYYIAVNSTSAKLNFAAKPGERIYYSIIDDNGNKGLLTGTKSSVIKYVDFK